jgi:polysaccharide pyruvyl transferase CsaB
VRFLLSGYYGFGNLGDEMLLGVIAGRLRERYPAAHIEVLSETPDQTARDFQIEATPRMELSGVKHAIERADIVLSGGGGLLQNATSLKSLLYYAGIVRAAIRAGRKTMVFAQSIGPLDFIGRQTVRECCKGLHAATVRDERSRVLLETLVEGTAVERSADPVFLIDSPDPRAAVDALGPAADPLVVVCVRKTAAFADGAGKIAAAVDQLAQLGARVVFLPIGGIADAEASTEILRRCRCAPMLLPLDGRATAAGVIARARLVIGVRLHALILAIRFGVPFLAIPYDPKVSALCEDIAYPLPALWTPGARLGSEGDPAAAARTAWERREELAVLVGEAAARMRVSAERNFEVLDHLVADAGRRGKET